MRWIQSEHSAKTILKVANYEWRLEFPLPRYMATMCCDEKVSVSMMIVQRDRTFRSFETALIPNERIAVRSIAQRQRGVRQSYVNLNIGRFDAGGFLIKQYSSS
jgi:hypothetical protein